MEEKTLEPQVESPIEPSELKSPNKIVEFWRTFKKKISEREKSIVTIVIVGIGVFGLLAFSAFQLLLKFGFIKQRPLLTKEQAYVSPSPTEIQRKKRKHLILKRETEEGEVVVGDFTNKETLRWENYLFFGTGTYDWNFEVFSHNLETGETELIYEEDSDGVYLSDLQVIGETLFFSIGGYLVKGETYWLDLPHDGQPQKLADSRNASIEFMVNRYWLVGGEGDACWGFMNYSLVDINTKEVTPIVKSHRGCSEGEEYLGIDKRDRMILSYHTADYYNVNPDGEMGVYSSVVALWLSDPEVREGIIAKQEIPNGVTIVHYSEEKDQLLLIGESVYIFDLSLNVLSKVIDVPNDWPKIRFDSWEGDIVCVRSAVDAVRLRKRYEINLARKQTIEESEACEPKPTPTPSPYAGFNEEDYFNREIERLTEQLNLPSNYKFVIEEKER